MNKKVIEYYNKNQDEFHIISYNKKIKVFKILYFGHEYKIDSYEFIFNPKYKVFEVFGINDMKTVLAFRKKGAWNLTARQPKEIIKYLSDNKGG